MKFRSRAPPRAKARVWRVTPAAPQGEWVDPTTILPPQEEATERDTSSRAMSSFDLRYGADITDVSDTMPSDLLDLMFPPKDDPLKRSGR